jgi:quercetin dioxygenase-like cupin family protein
MADHGLPHLDILGRGTFLDEVSATFKLKGVGQGTQVLSFADASDMVVLRVTIEAGGVAPWHTHTGTGLLINMGPGAVTNLVGDDCLPRVFVPGDAFVDPGHGELHGVLNESNEDVELIIVFFGIESGESPVVSTGGQGPEGCFDIP